MFLKPIISLLMATICTQCNAFLINSRYVSKICRLNMLKDDKPSIYSNTDRLYGMGEKPESAFNLGKDNFAKEFKQILKSINIFKKVNKQSLPESLGLKLSNEAVKNAEMIREKNFGRVEASPVARLLYDVGCLFLDTFFDERPIARFWFLETVARIPYFAYTSMLHLYESLGWWRNASLRKVHGAEEWNELHHLLIMESLGGDKMWQDRFLGYHCAILYYWLLIFTYLFSPRVACKLFSQKSNSYMMCYNNLNSMKFRSVYGVIRITCS